MTFLIYTINEKIAKMGWREHFNFKLTHSDPQIFVTSQWQLNHDSPSILYLLLRTLILVAFLTIAILSYVLDTDDEKRVWAIYLTNWGLSVCTCQSLLGFMMVSYTTVSIRVMDVPKVAGSFLRIYWLYWMFHIIATSLAFVISLIYWTLIHQPEMMSMMNVMVHGMNSVLMFLDLLIVGQPVRLGHFIYPVCFSLIYLTFTVIYYFCGGLARDGSPYIYPIVKWDEPGMTLKYLALVLAVIIVMHFLTWVVQLVRSKIANWRYNLYMRKTSFIYY